MNYLVVIRAIGALLDGGVLLLVPDLDTDNGVHVESGQLSGFDHSDADLRSIFTLSIFDDDYFNKLNNCSNDTKYILNLVYGLAFMNKSSWK